MSEDPPKPKHDHASLIFPKGFLWGAATSAHQVEGNNYFSDWWEFERSRPARMRSGKAADQYHLFSHDFELAHSLGHNSHRLSIEWSRIEPAEGSFNQTEIDHYKKVLQSLKDKDMTVMLTLWHFTLPKWVADQGGWENLQTVKYFARFLEKVVPELKELVDFWIVLNEPDGYIYTIYQAKLWPSIHDQLFGKFKAYWNLVMAHRRAYKLLKKLDPGKPVGIAQNIQSYEAYHKHSLREELATIFSDLVANHLFYFLTKGYHDFLGVNYYYHHRFEVDHSLVPALADVTKQYKDVSDLGWEVYPEGIFDVLTDLADGLPIYITECGIASTNDDRRTRFLIHYLQEVYQAIVAGVKVKGFFYWSLIDNFEWHQGFTPRFGLIEVNYRTQRRYPRPSAYVYEEIIRHNGIPHKLLKLLGHTLNVKKELAKIKSSEVYRHE